MTSFQGKPIFRVGKNLVASIENLVGYRA